MGMPCQVNSILKLDRSAYPPQLAIGHIHTAVKSGYRILPIDVPLQLVDEAWCAQADVIIRELSWKNQQTTLIFVIDRIYTNPFSVKD
jgi:Protein of unknown function (DUF2584)